MAGTTSMLRLLLVSSLLGVSSGWHDFTSADFHCWPASASEVSPATLTSCPGIELSWIVPPPVSIKAEADFSVTYELHVEESFYEFAVLPSNDFFSFEGYTNGSEAQEWCESVVCPTNVDDVAQETCCIHHVNVHSCPLADSSYCGPWIKATGDTYTHSDVLWGSPLRGNWTSEIGGLYVEGDNQIIAHFKLASMQIALYFDTEVLPKTVCGDDVCEDAEGEDCSTCPSDCGSCPLEAWQIALAGTGGFIVIAAIIIIISIQVYRQRKMLWDESWIISHDVIEAAQSKKAAFGSTMTLGQASKQSLGSGIDKTAQQTSSMQQSAANKQLFTKVTVVHGKTCAIREVPKKHMQLTKALRREVKKLRSIDHVNVCKLVGGCIQVPHVCILMEYCPKGSLSDVLQNLDIPVNWGFRFSFAHDIARGMAHLQSHDIVHGKLSSNNCVIDDRWTVKVTDCGIPIFRTPEYDSVSTQEEEDSYKYRQHRVYLAHEAQKSGFKPTQEADVFAFGVILMEIATRNDPYCDEDPSYLPEGWTPPLPDLSDTDTPDNACPCPRRYLELIKACWCINASQRPTFDSVKKTIQKINPNRQSPVDLMMTMMEKYSKHLEAIVMERTADLVVEKQKTDRLLYSMLPRAVADGLRQGKTISAEEYSSCTIYFSDIVGFTSISGKSNPFQVVALLNKLYICFDSIIENYDVYKVETIGDAYMVVSGVPIRNGIRHAHQVSSMAIDIVEACKTFTIPHLPDEPLKIRVGLHSGSVCAGVVGLKMPRYCLFGDTVNTASRMESNGEPYRIHLSNFTYTHLAEIGGFNLELRGVIPVKGKGDMKTWWLNGKSTEKQTTLEIHDKDPLRKISSSNDSGYNETGDGPVDSGKLTPVEDI